MPVSPSFFVMIAGTSWGNVAEWVGGVGAIAAAVVAVGLAIWGNQKSREAAEAQRSADRAQQARTSLEGSLIDFAEATGAVATRAALLRGWMGFTPLKASVFVVKDFGGDRIPGLVVELEHELARAERSRRALVAADIATELASTIGRAEDHSIEPMPRLHENEAWTTFYGPEGVVDRARSGEFLDDLAVQMRLREKWALDVLQAFDQFEEGR